MILQFEPTGTFDEKLLLFALGTFIFVIVGIVLIEISYRARQKRLDREAKKDKRS
jgi:sensor domain CHASE-containing protein